MQLNAVDVVVEKNGVRLLHGVSADLQQGELVAVLGPNGAGKTTLLRSLLGLQKLAQGQVCLDGQPIAGFSDQARAVCVSYLPQQCDLVWPNRVEDVIALGRYAHGASIGNLKLKDLLAVEEVIESCELQALQNRTVDSLSGGEVARVHCARVFAAQSPLLIADEPTAGLDLHHQHRLMELFRNYVLKNHGVMLVLHDVNLALAYADRIIWVREGAVVCQQTPDEVSAGFVADLYGVAASMVQSNGQKHMLISGYSARASAVVRVEK